MNVPHVEFFWSSLRATWAHRLLQATDGQIWAELALQKMGRALGRKKLNTQTLLETGLHTIKGKCKKIPFWSDVYKALSEVNKGFYEGMIHVTGELPLYGNSCFTENGEPLDRTTFTKTTTSEYSVCKDVLNLSENNQELAPESQGLEISPRDRGDQERLKRSVLNYLKDNGADWKDVTKDKTGPSHTGWSRLATTGKKSRIFYDLLREKDNCGRNDCERDWKEQGITFQDEKTWDKIYRLHAKTKTNSRIKFEEYRVIWSRQELRKNKELYALEGEDTDPNCSYCKRHKETELHIYTQCTATQRFWNEAATWFRQNIDERLPRVIQDKPKIFGYWNERPDDNSNIFLRSARYTIFRGRKSGTIYTLKAFKSTLADELSYKYKGTKWKKYEKDVNEMRSLCFYRREKGLLHINPKWLPPLH